MQSIEGDKRNVITEEMGGMRDSYRPVLIWLGYLPTPDLWEGEDNGQFALAWLERRALGASIIDCGDFPFLQGLHIFTLYANTGTNRKMFYS